MRFWSGVSALALVMFQTRFPGIATWRLQSPTSVPADLLAGADPSPEGEGTLEPIQPQSSYSPP